MAAVAAEDGSMRRSLALVSGPGPLGAHLVDEAARLLPLLAPELLLEEVAEVAGLGVGEGVDEGEGEGVRARLFRQRNGRASRKQVVPLLLKALASAVPL